MTLRKFNLLVLASLMWAVAGAVAPSEAVDRFVKTSGVRPESVAVKITDLSSGRVVAHHNPGCPLIPASIMKSVTTAALLKETGENFRYTTPVCADGPLEGGVLHGNIVVLAQGDPTVNSSAQPVGNDLTEEIADALVQMGVGRVEGRIVVDESSLAGKPRPDSWMPADFREAYGTGSHAFNFENNSAGSRSVENPKAVFEKRLLSRLASKGISVGGRAVPSGDRRMLCDHVSAPLDEIMRSCMMRSDNLFAEAMLRTYGKISGGDGSTENAAAGEMEMWRNREMPLQGVVIVDGSGLSRANRVTADFMSGVLEHMSGNEYYASFFPLAGQEGTLRSFLAGTELDSYMAMKTGSMKGIQCYAGYKVDEEYVPTHSVVIIMNDITGSRERAKKAAQKMLLDIFGGNTTGEENRQETKELNAQYE